MAIRLLMLATIGRVLQKPGSVVPSRTILISDPRCGLCCKNLGKDLVRLGSQQHGRLLEQTPTQFQVRLQMRLPRHEGKRGRQGFPQCLCRR
jgi:hypothetical protein